MPGSFVTLDLARKARDLRCREGLGWQAISERLGHRSQALQAGIRRLEAIEDGRAELARDQGPTNESHTRAAA